MKRSKYKNILCECDGYKFDSQKEMKRYQELKILVVGRVIKNLKLQPKFNLIGVCGQQLYIEGKLKKDGTPRQRKMTYSADFSYDDARTGVPTVEDVKGFKTDVYKIKKAIMKSMGYDIIET